MKGTYSHDSFRMAGAGANGHPLDYRLRFGVQYEMFRHADHAAHDTVSPHSITIEDTLRRLLVAAEKVIQALMKAMVFDSVQSLASMCAEAVLRTSTLELRSFQLAAVSMHVMSKAATPIGMELEADVEVSRMELSASQPEDGLDTPSTQRPKVVGQAQRSATHQEPSSMPTVRGDSTVDEVTSSAGTLTIPQETIRPSVDQGTRSWTQSRTLSLLDDMHQGRTWMTPKESL